MRIITRLHILLIAFICTIAALVSCNTTGCMENRSSIPIAEFYSSGDESLIIIDSVAIGGIGAPNDSLIVKVGEKASEVYLPFRSTTNTAKFFIAYQWTGCPENFADTLEFQYKSLPYFASEECGAMYRYQITGFSYTKHLIDSVSILDSLVTNADVAMMRIFYPVVTEEEEDLQ